MSCEDTGEGLSHVDITKLVLALRIMQREGSQVEWLPKSELEGPFSDFDGGAVNIFCLLTVRITINFFLRTCSMSKCISSSWPLSCQTEALCKCGSLIACHSLVNQQVMFPLFCLTNVSRHEEVKWSSSSQEKKKNQCNFVKQMFSYAVTQRSSSLGRAVPNDIWIQFFTSTLEWAPLWIISFPHPLSFSDDLRWALRRGWLMETWSPEIQQVRMTPFLVWSSLCDLTHSAVLLWSDSCYKQPE